MSNQWTLVYSPYLSRYADPVTVFFGRFDHCTFMLVHYTVASFYSLRMPLNHLRINLAVDLGLDGYNTSCTDVIYKGCYYRKWLIFPTPYEEAVMLATVVGSHLHCDSNRGLRLYVNSALVDIYPKTDVAYQQNQKLTQCSLVSAQPSVCQFRCVCPEEAAGCQMALLFFTKQEQIPKTQLCDLILT